MTIDDTSAPTATAPVNQRAYRAAIISFLVAIAGGIVAAIGYGTDNTGDLLGLGLAAALVGIGFGLVCWAKYLDLDEHVVQQREPLQITPAAQAEMHDEIETSTDDLRPPQAAARCSSAGRSPASSSASSGRSGRSGPKPRGERARTAWRAGSRLVTTDGAARSTSPAPATTSSSRCSRRGPSASTTPRSCCCACRRTS